jgi:predicted permease
MTMSLLDSLRTDVIFGWRQIRKRKATSAAAILSLGLAIGACTSAFRLIDALFWRPLPIAAPERLYALSRQALSRESNDTPMPHDNWDYLLYRRMRSAVSDRATSIAISFSERAELTYGSDEDTEKAHVQYISGSLFGSFGIRPALGRLLTDADDGAPGSHPVAVLSYDYWVRRFGADTRLTGRTYRLGKRLFQIVGVAAPGFTGTEPGTAIDVFMPATMHWGVIDPELRKFSFFRVFVHVNQGVPIRPTRDRLHAALQAFNEGAEKQFPETLFMEPSPAGVSGMQKNYRLSLEALSVLVALVLLIACANVANLMTAQTAARSREMALRVSIGAGRRRLVQLVMAEGAITALLAALTGALFAWRAAPFIVGRINASDDPAHLLLPADWRVLGFGVALTFAITLLFGLMPALGVSRVQPALALKGGDDPRSRRHRMHALIALQAAFCFLVLFVAGLFATSFDRLSHQSVGFSAERLLTLDIVTPNHNEPMSLWDRVANRVRQTPGVEAVAFADWALLDGYGFKTNDVSVNGGPPGNVTASFINVSPGWIGTMKIPLLGGRDFRADDASPGSAIVNETFARQYFNGANPVGKWFEGTSAWMRGQRFQIVGIVRDARYRYLRQPPLPVAYTPFNRPGNGGCTMQGGTLVVRTYGSNPLALAATLRSEIPKAQPGFRVSNIRPQTELMEAQTVRERLLAMLALFFALVALSLASIGLYGVLDYSVLQRRREIGIRIAIGAQGARIARLITLEVFSMVLAGALVGLAAGMAASRSIESLLYDVKSTDPRMLALPWIALITAALLASLPAVVRALRIDPAKMLRAE